MSHLKITSTYIDYADVTVGYSNTFSVYETVSFVSGANPTTFEFTATTLAL
jgi:hypothetical protein